MTSQLSLCAQDVRNNDHDQFLCSLFAPGNVRETIFALQVFYRETSRIRSLVNEPHLGLIRLQWWRDMVEDAYKGKIEGSENGTHKEIIHCLKGCNIKEESFDHYFNGRAFDMEDRAHEKLEQLLQYCTQTGGAIAQMKAIVLGSNNEATLKAAEHLGAAETLCDIIKTLPYQARSGRTKIPKDLVLKHDVDIKGFFEFKPSTALNSCVKDMVIETRNLISQARDLMPETDSNARAVFLVTISIEDYLKRLEKVGADPFNPNIGGGRLSRQLKMAYMAWRGKY